MKQNIWKYIFGGVIFVSACIGLIAYSSHSITVPNISAQTTNNETIKFGSQENRQMFVVFWATSCPACVDEMSDLIKAYKKYPNFHLITVAMEYDDLEQIKVFTKENALPFPVIFDKNDSLSKAFGDVMVTPTSFLVNAQGKVSDRFIGKLDFEELSEIAQKNFY